MNRRNFLKTAIAGVAAAAVTPFVKGSPPKPPKPKTPHIASSGSGRWRHTFYFYQGDTEPIRVRYEPID